MIENMTERTKDMLRKKKHQKNYCYPLKKFIGKDDPKPDRGELFACPDRTENPGRPEKIREMAGESVLKVYFFHANIKTNAMCIHQERR